MEPPTLAVPLTAEHYGIPGAVARRVARALRQDAEEIESEMWVVLWKAALDFDPARHSRGADGYALYLFARCVRGAYDYVRREATLSRGGGRTRYGLDGILGSRETVRGSGGRYRGEIPDLRPDPARRKEGDEAAEVALGRLPPGKARDAFARHLAGASCREIATEAGVHKSRAIELVKRARAEIRNLYREGRLEGLV